MFQKILDIFRLKPSYENRIFGLDIMRALAIIFVVMGHGSSLLRNANTEFPWIKLLDGVEMFFVLSGFLIGGILIKIFEKDEPFTFKTIRNFWVRRWFRTLPNYYLILAVNILFVYFGIIKEDFSQFNWKFFLFLQNFSSPFYGFFWESWSLSIEEWFYIFFPIILWLMYLGLFKLKVSKKNIFLISILIFLSTPFILRVFIASNFEVDNFWLGVKILKVVIFRLDSIAFGILAAFIKKWHPNIWSKSKNYSFISGIIISYIIMYSNWLPNDYFMKVFLISVQSFGCFLLLPKFDSIRKGPKILVKAFTHISLISYSMYLINLALVAEVILHNYPPWGVRSSWLLYGIYWLIVIGVSTLIYKYYEKPIMDLRDKWR